MNKKTVVIGASENPERYAYKATVMLKKFNHPVVPVGIKQGSIEGEVILTSLDPVTDVDTVTLYVGPANQAAWIDYVLSLHPKRIIFNPGTEGGPMLQAANDNGIEVVEACTLVLLSTGQY